MAVAVEVNATGISACISSKPIMPFTALAFDSIRIAITGSRQKNAVAIRSSNFASVHTIDRDPLPIAFLAKFYGFIPSGGTPASAPFACRHYFRKFIDR